jgi:hypothetical protein
MDDGRRTPLDAPGQRHAADTSGAGPAQRCGWCGLLPLPEHRTLVEEHGLCGVCFGFLQGVDWQRVLSDGRRRSSSNPGPAGIPAIGGNAGLKASRSG